MGIVLFREQTDDITICRALEALNLNPW